MSDESVSDSTLATAAQHVRGSVDHRTGLDLRYDGSVYRLLAVDCPEPHESTYRITYPAGDGRRGLRRRLYRHLTESHDMPGAIALDVVDKLVPKGGPDA